MSDDRRDVAPAALLPAAEECPDSVWVRGIRLPQHSGVDWEAMYLLAYRKTVRLHVDEYGRVVAEFTELDPAEAQALLAALRIMRR